MAYVLWRVFMKKYSRVRLGLHGATVTPTTQRAVTYDEESWKPSPDEEAKAKEEDLTRTEVRKSKTKKVKHYFKKCKNALGKSSSSCDITTPTEENCTVGCSWYLEDLINEGEVKELEEIFEDALLEPLTATPQARLEVASIVVVKGVKPEDKSCDLSQQNSVKSTELTPRSRNSDASNDSGLGSTLKSDKSSAGASSDNRSGFRITVDENFEKTAGEGGSGPETASLPLKDLQGQVDGVEGEEKDKDATPSVRSEVERLVDEYFGDIYPNYANTKKCLIRQARDVLVCEYMGSLSRFEDEFCVQTSKLLRDVKDGQQPRRAAAAPPVPAGWPLSLGAAGVVTHLAPPEAARLRPGDCFVYATRGGRLAVGWRTSAGSNAAMCSAAGDGPWTPADLESACYDECDATVLPELLQNLLVSVEHAVRRVPLDDLQFPCPQCHQYVPLDRADEELEQCACRCSCGLPESPVTKKDSSIQTSPMFEFDGSIPHIDSDEDDMGGESREASKTGSLSKRLEIARPKKISELPDKLLMSGINLPGTTDLDGRPIILCYAECISRATLNKYEIAKLLLYYSSIPPLEAVKNGFTILLLAENEADYKILEVLDKSVCLIMNAMRIHRFLIWTPGVKSSKEKRTLVSKAEAVLITEEATLLNYLERDQAPASCGGTCTHDQLEWVEFFKQCEPFLEVCRSAGRSLLTTLSQLRKEEVPHQVTRRFLNHQCRQITKALESETIHSLQKDGKKTLSSLQERQQWLAGSRDVKRSASFAYDSFSAVERVTKRLEQLRQERVERLRELARYRALKEEAEELMSWTKKIGEETLNSLTLLLRSAADATAVKSVAHSFDEFFFNAWRQIEKSNDLSEEGKNIKDSKGHHLKEVAQELQHEMKIFRERLEDARERIEDSTRCFLLLESCHDILEDDTKEQEEFIKLATKSGNDRLRQICENVDKNQLESSTHHQTKPPDKGKTTQDKSPPYSHSEITATSTPKSQNAQIRRRSVSSEAYIYHCSHHANGEVCNCCESDTENTTVSYQLKKKYLRTLQTYGGRDNTLERKNSGTLGGIKEERESMENLLEPLESNYRRCDSGLSSTVEANSIIEEASEEAIRKKRTQRPCSCQYYREGCSGGSSSTGSQQDNQEQQQDSIIEEGKSIFSNSSDDIEDDHYGEERRKVPPVSANSHLYCHASNLDLPSDSIYHNMDPKTQKTLKYIIKEMIETEKDYVKSLDYIIINYIPELQREDIPQALRGQRNTVFGNVEKIFEFHSHHFLKELVECENNPLSVGHIFLKYNKKFYLYALYNKNKPKSESLMSEYGTLFFKSKQIELGDKMDLASYLLKPVQRMGKYALLLQQMMKACPSPSTESSDRVIVEFEDLKLAEEMVRFQLRHGNDLLAMDSIRECDVNLKEQGRLLRQNEFLVWEGRSGKKSLRQVFLFEELILFSKAKRFPDRKNLDLYYYKNSIKMTDIGLTEKKGESPVKFEIWFRKRKPNDTFTLQSVSEDVKNVWTEEISQLLWKQAIKNREVRMAEMNSMGIGNKPCLDIRPSADQISDRSISFAQLSRSTYHSLLRLTTRFHTLPAAPRFRNSIVGSIVESCRTVKRPHSVISMSSMSSSSSSSGGSATASSSQGHGTLFESSCDSPKPYHRSATLNSQCSVESGIIADMSMGSDECSEQAHSGL